jgi:hypothetical protein
MNTKTFETKTGYCHITPTQIILNRDGIVGDTSKIIIGNGIARILIIYSFLGLFLLYISFQNFQNDKVTSLIFLLIATYLFYKVFQSRNNSATPIIERSTIENINFIEAKKGITRSYFEVYFKDKNNQVKRRLILLPGSLNDGDNETKNALKILKEENLI